ncbi:MAG: hypothetical protein U0359_01785 [Byssovorax sp.]
MSVDGVTQRAPGADAAGMEIPFRLPIGDWPRALFRSDFGYNKARLTLDGAVLVEAETRAELEQGVQGSLAGGEPISMKLVTRGGKREVEVVVGGELAAEEGRIWAKPTRSAWIHAFIALGGSAAGFLASYFYLVKAAELHSDWAQKMGNHTAGWHLLLTFTLFPASVWGQRLGIRAVQLVSLVFFFIHVGIALANSEVDTFGIAFFNALSGVLFLASLLYGNRAHRDMDPVAALRAGRA